MEVVKKNEEVVKKNEESSQKSVEEGKAASQRATQMLNPEGKKIK
ncbi:MAG: hypothetical protein HW421_1997 [Ignavibacteria bacterium]|nr:hypothetical protein [Ignavibacteria bacterium]